MLMGRVCSRASGVAVFATLLISLVHPGISHAQRNSCDSEYTDTGKRIKCKLGNMSDSFDTLITTTTGDDTGLFTEVQKKQLGNLKERAKRDTERVNQAEYKHQAKRNSRDVVCVIRERIGDVSIEEDLNENEVCDEDEVCLGNEDGVCQEDEFVFDDPYKGGCAEQLDDGIGDDDGICDPKGASGKFREVCLQDCGQDATLAEGEETNVDPGKADDVEQAIEDMTSVMDETNSGMAKLIAARRSALSAEQFCSPNSMTPCEFLSCLETRGRSSTGEYITDLATAAAGANALLETCRDLGNQTIPIPFVGGSFDAAIACLPIGLAANGVLLAATVIELRDDLETSERVDAIGACAQTTGSQVQSVKILAQEVIDLLKMPPGKRPGYPLTVE